MSTGLEFIWRKGNVGTNHLVVEVRSPRDADGKAALKGYLTLTPDEFGLLQQAFNGDGDIWFKKKESDKRRHEEDRGAAPEHIHPVVPFSSSRKKKT